MSLWSIWPWETRQSLSGKGGDCTKDTTLFYPHVLTVAFIYDPTECALEDETYADGAETEVDCNRCVCSCGHWVCTAMTCDGEPYWGQEEGAELWLEWKKVMWVWRGKEKPGTGSQWQPPSPPGEHCGCSTCSRRIGCENHSRDVKWERMVAQSTNKCQYQTEITILKEKLISEKYVPGLFVY